MLLCVCVCFIFVHAAFVRIKLMMMMMMMMIMITVRCLSVCSSVCPQQQTRYCRFAAAARRAGDVDRWLHGPFRRYSRWPKILKWVTWLTTATRGIVCRAKANIHMANWQLCFTDLRSNIHVANHTVWSLYSSSRYGPITIAIRARFESIRVWFELDSATTRYEMRTIRVRFEHATTSYEELCAFEQ